MADVELLPTRSAGLRQVAGRCMPATNQNGALTRGMTTTAHFVREKISGGIEITYPNYRMNGTTEQSFGASDFKLALKMPDNSIILSEQNAGGDYVSVPAGNAKFTFTLNNPIPENSIIMPRVAQRNPNGILWTQVSGGVDSAYGSAPQEGMEIGTTDNDKTTSGTISFANGISLFPLVIAAQTRRPSGIVFGTSREVGDYISDATLDTGLISSILCKVMGVTNHAMSGTLLSNWNAGTHTFLNQLIAAGYWTHAFDEYGVNDVPSLAASVVIAARATFAAALKAARPDLVVIGSTLYPYVTTSDIMLTKSGQTQGVAQQRIFVLNDAVRAGIAGEDFCWDAADGIDPFREGKYPVSRDPSATSRTPCLFTGQIAGSTLTVSAVSSGTLSPGDAVVDPAQPVQGAVLASTWIVEQLTGTAGAAGTYRLNRQFNGSGTYPKPNVSSRALSTAGLLSGDGLHLQFFGRQLIARNKGPELLSLIR